MNSSQAFQRRQKLLTPVVCLLILCAAGCGGKGTVSGKVLYKGNPLPSGTVTFVPTNGGGAFTASIQEDGSYRIDKLPPGAVNIAVKTLPPPKMPSNVPDKLGPPKGFIPKDVNFDPSVFQSNSGKYVPIPDFYGDPNKSGINFTVKSGKNECNIDLK